MPDELSQSNKRAVKVLTHTVPENEKDEKGFDCLMMT